MVKVTQVSFINYSEVVVGRFLFNIILSTKYVTFHCNSSIKSSSNKGNYSSIFLLKSRVFRFITKYFNPAALWNNGLLTQPLNAFISFNGFLNVETDGNRPLK